MDSGHTLFYSEALRCTWFLVEQLFIYVTLVNSSADSWLSSLLLCRFTLSNNSRSLVVRILDYGGIITEINVPDRNGQVADINLGFDDMAGECT